MIWYEMVKISSKLFQYFFFTRNTIFTYDYEGDPIYYYCEVKAPLVTSTSDKNPGRRSLATTTIRYIFISSFK